MNKTKILVLSLVFLLSLVLLDQLSKFLVRFSSGFYLCNSGMAWGIKLPSFLFWFFWIVIVIFLIYLIFSEIFQKKSLNIFLLASLSLILSGAIGNLLDRIFFGCVIDFINIKIWPIFNLADSFITIGAAIILIDKFKKISFKKFLIL